MWILKHKSGNQYFYLHSKDLYIVGRNNSDIQLQQDSSISREHARFILKISEDCVKLYLLDKGSKYGTYLNDGIQSKKPIKPNTEIAIKHMDCIKFGILENIWTVTNIDYITTSSALSTDTKRKVVDIVKSISGSYENTWSSACTHLTMEKITLTIKLVQALVATVPVVTVKYWEELSKCIMSNKCLPLEESFVPTETEPLINCDSTLLLVNKDRKTTFENKTFVFLSNKQCDQFKQIIIDAKGETALLEQSKMTKSMLCRDGIIVIQYIKNLYSQLSQTVQIMDDIESYLKKKGRRLIPESEIGLSILHCSTEKFCNPLFTFESNVLRPSLSVNPVNEILAAETERVHDNNVFNVSVKQDIATSKKFCNEGFSIESTTSTNEISMIESLHINQNRKSYVSPAKTVNDTMLTGNKTQKRKRDLIEDIPSNAPNLVPIKISSSKRLCESNEEMELFCFETDVQQIEKRTPKHKSVPKPSPIKINTKMKTNLRLNEASTSTTSIIIPTKKISPKRKSVDQLQNLSKISTKIETNVKLHTPPTTHSVVSNELTMQKCNTFKSISIDPQSWLSCHYKQLQLPKNEQSMDILDSSTTSEYKNWIDKIREGIAIESKNMTIIENSLPKLNVTHAINFKRFKKVARVY